MYINARFELWQSMINYVATTFFNVYKKKQKQCVCLNESESRNKTIEGDRRVNFLSNNNNNRAVAPILDK